MKTWIFYYRQDGEILEEEFSGNTLREATEKFNEAGKDLVMTKAVL
jgi:hypothetical protein